MVVDEEAIQSIEKAGYPRHFIIKSLNGQDLNHCTAFYYLITQKHNF
jgi:hypothetical protein